MAKHTHPPHIGNSRKIVVKVKSVTNGGTLWEVCTKVFTPTVRELFELQLFPHTHPYTCTHSALVTPAHVHRALLMRTEQFVHKNPVLNER